MEGHSEEIHDSTANSNKTVIYTEVLINNDTHR